MANQQMIGDKEEKSKLEELIEQAKKDPAVKRVVDKADARAKTELETAIKAKKELEKQRYKRSGLFSLGDLRFKTCNGAHEILKRIERHIGFDRETGLIKQSINSPKVTIKDNALLAIAYYASGRKEDAKKLIEGIEKYTDFKFDDNGLVCYKNENPKLSDNVALALAGKSQYFTSLLIKKIEEYFHFDKDIGLFYEKNKDDSSHLNLQDNALLGIAYIISGEKKKGLELIKYVNTKLCKDFESSENSSFIIDNAALTLAYFACGAKEDGLRLFESVSSSYGLNAFNNLTGLFEYEYDTRTEYNVWLALAYMANEYYKEK